MAAQPKETNDWVDVALDLSTSKKHTIHQILFPLDFVCAIGAIRHTSPTLTNRQVA